MLDSRLEAALQVIERQGELITQLNSYLRVSEAEADRLRDQVKDLKAQTGGPQDSDVRHDS